MLDTKNFIFVTFLAAPCCFGATIFNQDFGNDPEYGTWVDGTGPIASTTINETIDGIAFSFRLEITGTTDGTNNDLIFSGNRPRFNATNTNSLKQATFSVTDVTSAGNTVVFDGFTSVFQFDNNGANNFNYSGSGGGTAGTHVSTGSGTFTFPTLLQGDLTIEAVDDGTNNNFRIQEAGLQFSVVPEPSTTALLGLGGLAMVLRRRR
ncbi:hypothetical protein NT6N_21110 [Oceaniferula spumae]|uniref:Ice-binding protein C-terminal domain-containing protein n=1 Tax=Oceaniferula spumae TaxID=2979115 RepID=A0AAT9FM62_9BACT